MTIANIVVGSPFGEWRNDRVEGEPRQLGEFYAALLGMRIVRDDWIKIATDSGARPQLAFGDGWSDERPPRWPDPEYPQQVHLDLFVRDVDDAAHQVLATGGTLLQEGDGFRTFADPFGHPVCLAPPPLGVELGGAPGVVGRVVFDCPEPAALAPFYEGLLGMTRRVEDGPGRVVVAREDGALPMIALQRAADFVVPTWPDPSYPAQIHLDLVFEDGAEARSRAEHLGARPLPAMGGSCPVYADPAGHPFCLCTPGQ